ncbi:right-handed parallel beta-helix repeat-containing protein [Pseudonocardia abyssalis]|uniref:right-handed parallel beta-helix repeat-containing protein n=1 Tax=Pseudonocardia abyssalis TaxID=2792008 RepID=UPI001C4A3CC7|nr:right-handed parallel beta-helix repeat-containing protein [Pseudonocardia abyssalis]MBW0118334.1 right-handed parallel beta-helix repeat-containing protein [Pseudonocardia abyssalis]
MGVTLAGIVGTVVLDRPPAAPTASVVAAPDVVPDVDASPDATSLAVDAAGDAQARVVTAEDDRVYAIVSESPGTATPYEFPAVAPSIVPTVVLTPRDRPYDLPALERLGAAQRLDDGDWMITRSVLVGRDAVLRIEAPGGTLRMASGTAGFASLIAFKGTLTIGGAPGAPLTVTSWDPAAGAVDTALDDGRSYLRSVGGRLDLAHVQASELGFWSGRTGGVAWTGGAGEPGRGSATATTVDRSHYGMFTSRVDDLTINGGAVRDNAADGLLVHRESAGVTVRELEATGNARHGVAVSAGTERILLSGVTANGNRGTGIRLDGAALAASASAGGASTAPGRGFTVERSTVTGNGDVGILAAGNAGLVLRDNTVSGSPDGIVVRGTAAAPELTGNTVSADGFGIALRDGVGDAQLTGNTVGASTVAVQVADAAATLRGNTVDGAARYAVSLVGAVDGSVVETNRLAGRGPAAIDVNRVGLGSNVAINGNDESAWTLDRDDVAYWTAYVVDHPLILLWLLILLLPVIAQLRARRRNRAGERIHPYAHVPPGPATASLTPVDRIALARAVAAAGRTTSRPGHPPVPPHRVAPPADLTETTTLMPVTRVTIVSGDGSTP